MFIINPDSYLLPSYRISPFRTADIANNNRLLFNDKIDSYFQKRFNQRRFTYTETGRTAINLALQYYNLQKDDEVCILTSSGNFYISGCVTTEIEKFCNWSREITDDTKIILVNHAITAII